MNTNRMQFRVDRGPFKDYELSVFAIHGDDKVAIPTGPLTMKVCPESEARREPILTFRQEAAQQLMDELWLAGIRPSDGTGSAGQLAATERHLADMRALVFKTGAPTK